MGQSKKTCSLLILLVTATICFAVAHNEAPDANEVPLSSEHEDLKPEIESLLARRDENYDAGLPIDSPEHSQRRLAASDVPPEAETIAAKPSSALPVTPRVAPVYPPMHPRYRRIYNPDERASIEDHKFMAAVLVNRELWCGAAIIDKDKVLTAAHCLQLQYNNRFFREYVKMLTVRVGSTNATAGGEVLRVVEIMFHPNYKPSTLEFNVAVLRLHKNLSFERGDYASEKIEVSRDTSVPVDSNVMFLGWGSVLGGGGTGGTVLLQKVEMPVYDFADCQQIYGRELVTHTNFCAGFITQAKNVCNHDAGGPALLDNKLVGILSFSSKRCDIPDQPAVFTTVGAIAPWLDEINEMKPKSLKVV